MHTVANWLHIVKIYLGAQRRSKPRRRRRLDWPVMCAKYYTNKPEPKRHDHAKTRNYHNTNKNKSQPHHKIAENIKTKIKQRMKLQMR